VIRVVLTGSESTGKSSLAAELARHYDAPLVPEFVRGYAQERGGVIEFADHGPITRGQMALEDQYIARGGSLLVQDTDLLSTVVYCRHYFGRCPEWIEVAAAARRPTLYLLCEIDVPWVADGVRDRGDRREEIQALFRDEVLASGVRTVAIVGDEAARLAAAVAAIDSLG
jgi:NadR type nicotinamide-nucleotide adenylyltransferase